MRLLQYLEEVSQFPAGKDFQSHHDFHKDFPRVSYLVLKSLLWMYHGGVSRFTENSIWYWNV